MIAYNDELLLYKSLFEIFMGYPENKALTHEQQLDKFYKQHDIDYLYNNPIEFKKDFEVLFLK